MTRLSTRVLQNAAFTANIRSVARMHHTLHKSGVISKSYYRSFVTSVSSPSKVSVVGVPKRSYFPGTVSHQVDAEEEYKKKKKSNPELEASDIELPNNDISYKELLKIHEEMDLRKTIEDVSNDNVKYTTNKSGGGYFSFQPTKEDREIDELRKDEYLQARANMRDLEKQYGFSIDRLDDPHYVENFGKRNEKPIPIEEREEYTTMFDEEADHDPLTTEEKELTPDERNKIFQAKLLKKKGAKLPEHWAKYKRSVLDLVHQGKIAEAAAIALPMIHSTTSDPVPKSIYAAFLNKLIPPVPYILGLPLKKPEFQPGATDFIISLMECAREQGYIFSDVEWRNLLRTVAGETNSDNHEKIRVKLEYLLNIFRTSLVYRGKTVYRFTSNTLAKTQNANKKLANLNAAHVSIVEQEAWMIHYCSYSNPLAVECFEKIHNSAVLGNENNEGFLMENYEKTIKNRQDLVESSDNHATYVVPDVLSQDYYNTRWTNKRHNPNLFNYSSFIDYHGYMSTPDDILDNPFIYQPPHLKDKFYPRISMDLRDDQTALFPNALILMKLFTSTSSGNIEQAEYFFRHMTKILINTEKYYTFIAKNIQIIDKYRETHDYDPDVDFDMAQNLEAPQGEEFRYLAGYPAPELHSSIAFRDRCNHLISQMVEHLVTFYKYERRPSAIEELLEHLYEMHKKYPQLYPLPSMFVIQLFIDSCIEAKDLARARKWLRTLQNINDKLPHSPEDPLIQTILGRIKRKKNRLEEKFLKHNQPAVSSNHLFKDKYVHKENEKVVELLDKTQQLRFYSLRIEMQAHITYAKAAIAAATHDFNNLATIINDDLANVNFPSQYRARVYACIFKRLLHASRTDRVDNSLGLQVMDDYEKLLVESLSPEQFQLFDDVRTQKSKDMGDLSEEINQKLLSVSSTFFNNILSPKPLTLGTTLRTVTPGQLINILHTAQNQGVVITDTLISYVFSVICMLPDNIGNIGAYKLFQDLPVLGISPSRAIINRIMEASAMHAEYTYKYGRDETSHKAVSKPNQRVLKKVTEPHPLAKYVTTLNNVYSWMHPMSLFKLMHKYEVVPDFKSYKYAIMYYTLKRNWDMAISMYKMALDQAYFGSYSSTIAICHANKIPLHMITDELPYQDRLLVNEVRQMMLVRSGSVLERNVVFQIIKDIQLSEDNTITPLDLNSFIRYSGRGEMFNSIYDFDIDNLAEVEDVSTVGHYNLTEVGFDRLSLIINRIKNGKQTAISNHLQLSNRLNDLTTIHNIFLLNMTREDGKDFIFHRHFMELIGITPNIETMLKSLHVAIKQAVFPDQEKLMKTLRSNGIHKDRNPDYIRIMRYLRSIFISDYDGSVNNTNLPMAVIPTNMTSTVTQSSAVNVFNNIRQSSNTVRIDKSHGNSMKRSKYSYDTEKQDIVVRDDRVLEYKYTVDVEEVKDYAMVSQLQQYMNTLPRHIVDSLLEQFSDADISSNYIPIHTLPDDLAENMPDDFNFNAFLDKNIEGGQMIRITVPKGSSLHLHDENSPLVQNSTRIPVPAKNLPMLLLSLIREKGDQSKSFLPRLDSGYEHTTMLPSVGFNGYNHIDVVLQEMQQRNILLLPRVLNHIVTHSFMTHANSHLLIAPYYFILSKYIQALPLLDTKGRSVHLLAGLNIHMKGDELSEEAVLYDSQGERRHVDKLYGKHVVYQHECVNNGFFMMKGLLQQADIVQDKINTLITHRDDFLGTRNAESTSRYYSELINLHQLHNDSLRTAVTIYSNIENYLPPSIRYMNNQDSAASTVFSTILSLPTNKPDYFQETGIKPPKHSNYTDSALHMVDKKLMGEVISLMSSTFQTSKDTYANVRSQFEFVKFENLSQGDLVNINKLPIVPFLQMNASHYEEVLMMMFRYKHYDSIAAVVDSWHSDILNLVKQAEYFRKCGDMKLAYHFERLIVSHLPTDVIITVMQLALDSSSTPTSEVVSNIRSNITQFLETVEDVKALDFDLDFDVEITPDGIENIDGLTYTPHPLFVSSDVNSLKKFREYDSAVSATLQSIRISKDYINAAQIENVNNTNVLSINYAALDSLAQDLEGLIVDKYGVKTIYTDIYDPDYIADNNVDYLKYSLKKYNRDIKNIQFTPHIPKRVFNKGDRLNDASISSRVPFGNYKSSKSEDLAHMDKTVRTVMGI